MNNLEHLSFEDGFLSSFEDILRVSSSHIKDEHNESLIAWDAKPLPVTLESDGQYGSSAKCFMILVVTSKHHRGFACQTILNIIFEIATFQFCWWPFWDGYINLWPFYSKVPCRCHAVNHRITGFCTCLQQQSEFHHPGFPDNTHLTSADHKVQIPQSQLCVPKEEKKTTGNLDAHRRSSVWYCTIPTSI